MQSRSLSPRGCHALNEQRAGRWWRSKLKPCRLSAGRFMSFVADNPPRGKLHVLILD
jgi:hypothetical protein